MCDSIESGTNNIPGTKTVFVEESIGMALAHDITEIRAHEFKGAAFRKGHIVRPEDVDHLRRLGKERLFVLSLGPDDLHENDAAARLAAALMGEGVRIDEEPKEGKINLAASRDGLLKINREALLAINMLGDVMCATLHGNTPVTKSTVVAGTRAIPLVVKRGLIDQAVAIGQAARSSGCPVVQVKTLRKPKAGVVITGNEVYQGRIGDAFAPIITGKIERLGGEVIGVYYAPDDASFIEQRLRELLDSGANLLLTTGGMSVDPDDVTRFAVRSLGAFDITYGSPVLPGAMFLVGYIERTRSADPELVPVLGIPACGMYHAVTVLDIVLPRILAGEKIGRPELAELGHGGLCCHCKVCRYPACQFGK
jgi:hypothetical protein